MARGRRRPKRCGRDPGTKYRVPYTTTSALGGIDALAQGQRMVAAMRGGAPVCSGRLRASTRMLGFSTQPLPVRLGPDLPVVSVSIVRFEVEAVGYAGFQRQYRRRVGVGDWWADAERGIPGLTPGQPYITG